MPLELLRELLQEQLPMTITDPEKIDKLRVLRAADHVACTMSSPGGREPYARVLAITREGRAALVLDDRLRRGNT